MTKKDTFMTSTKLMRCRGLATTTRIYRYGLSPNQRKRRISGGLRSITSLHLSKGKSNENPSPPTPTAPSLPPSTPSTRFSSTSRINKRKARTKRPTPNSGFHLLILGSLTQDKRKLKSIKKDPARLLIIPLLTGRANLIRNRRKRDGPGACRRGPQGVYIIDIAFFCKRLRRLSLH